MKKQGLRQLEWTGFPKEALLEPKDQNKEAARDTGPTFLVMETARAKALREEGSEAPWKDHGDRSSEGKGWREMRLVAMEVRPGDRPVGA